jgi:hypothetical protein
LKYLNLIVKKVQALIAFGTDIGEAAENDTFAKRIRIVNGISLLCASIGLLSIPFDQIAAPPWMIWEDVLSFIGFLAIPFLNKAGKHQISRVLFLIFGNTIAYLDSALMEYSTGVYLLFFGLSAMSMIIFDLTEKTYMFLATLMTVVGFVYFQMQAPGKVDAYYIYSGLASFIIISLSSYFLQKTNFRSEEKLRLTRTQAIESEKMAALGEMSGGMAHEINNPLMVLRLNADLLKKNVLSKNADPQKTMVLLEKIDRMVDRISAITNSLHMFARNAEGDPIVPAPLNSIISSTLELCSERFKNYEISLTVDPFDTHLKLKCRSTQISQVLLNLLNNSLHAVMHLDKKWVKIHISNDDVLKISITDSGKGIAPQIQDKIFQPFYTTKPPGQGTGLGLSVSRGIIESHGGRINLVPGVAHTQFVIEFPKGAVEI